MSDCLSPKIGKYVLNGNVYKMDWIVNLEAIELQDVVPLKNPAREKGVGVHLHCSGKGLTFEFPFYIGKSKSPRKSQRTEPQIPAREIIQRISDPGH